MKRDSLKSSSVRWGLPVLLGLAFFIILAGGGWFYCIQQQAAKSRAALNLTTIAQLKTEQITNWRRETFADAGMTMESQGLLSDLAEWQVNPRPELRAKMVSQLRGVQTYGRYHDVALMDLQGRVLLSVANEPDQFAPDFQKYLAAAVAKHQPVMTDLYIPPEDGDAHLEAVAPLFAGGVPIGAVVLRHEAQENLFPMLKQWPTPSESAETILVRREGDSVLFLNDLRYQPGTALKFRVPLSQVKLPGVQAALGREGSFTGPDYRGVLVMSCVRQIPDSPWVLVVKIDEAEILSGWYSRARLMIGFIVTLLLVVGLMTVLVFQERRRLREFKVEILARLTSEEQLQFALETIQLGAWNMSLVDHTTQRTPLHDKIYGYPKMLPEWTYAMFLEHIVPEDRAAVDRQFQAAVAAKSSWQFECRIRRADGAVRWLLCAGNHHLDSDGNATRVAGIIQDITEQKEMMATLEASKERFRKMFVSMVTPCALSEIICDAAGQPVDYVTREVNPAYEKVIGHKREDRICHRASEFMPPEELAEWVKIFGPVALTGKSVSWEIFSERYQKILAGNAYCPEPGQFITTFRDVTERRQLEKQENLMTTVLRRLNQGGPLEDLLRDVSLTIQNHLDVDAVGLRMKVGEDFPFFTQNGLTATFERLESKLIMRTPEGKACRNPDGSAKLECMCGVVLEGRTDPASPMFTKGGSFWTNNLEPLVQLTPAKDLRLNPRNRCTQEGFLSQALIPLRTSGGKIMGLLQLNDRRRSRFSLEEVEFLEGIAASLAVAVERATAQKELEKRTRQLSETLVELHTTQEKIILQEKMRGLGQMASGIAHDFNNALAPVIGFSELLLKNPEKRADDALVVKWLENIHTSATDAATVVRRMREFGRQTQDKNVGQPIQLAGLVRETIELTRPRWKDQTQATGITIKIATDLQPVPEIPGDASAIRELLTNLIFNAVDAMPTGGTLTLSTGVTGEVVYLAVRDTGAGMSAEVQQRCFDPFFTTKEEHGTGLGLAMVHGIVQRHGGEIALQSAPGRGTTITVTFPIRETKAPAAVPANAPRKALRVLVVDDNAGQCEVVKEWLTDAGHTVTVAASGTAALPVLKAGKFDLLITDQAMPGISGEQLALTVHQSQPAMRIILMTGFGDIMAANGVKPPHIDALLNKPTTHELLETALAEVFPAPV